MVVTDFRRKLDRYILREPVLFGEVETGQETLRRMASVERYNSWIHSRISPFLGERLLEVGCGLGNMTGYLLNRELVVAVDRLPESVSRVRDLFDHSPNLQAVEGDICDRRVVAGLLPYSLDTAVCINVLEHIENDALALRMMSRAVGNGGRVVVLAPAGAFLYGSLDIGLGHYRRYDLHDLVRKMEFAGCRVKMAFHMNVAGVPGWLLNSRILKRRLLPTDMLAVFNLLVPVFDRVERLVKPSVGLSVVVVGEVASV